MMVFAIACAWFFFEVCLNGAELHVQAAASLTDVLKEIAVSYEKGAGDKLVCNFGPSSMLARQIEEGVPADIFISADEARMDALEKAGHLFKGTRRNLLSNTLVIVVASDSSVVIKSPEDLSKAEIKRIALTEPQAVPAGIYARQYLQKLKLWDRVIDKVVPTENVRAALAAIESGNVEAGIVYKTDALSSKKVRVAYEVSATEGPKIIYPVALIKNSKQSERAKIFLSFLSSEPSLAIFEKFGFIALR